MGEHYVESLKGELTDELLNGKSFHMLTKAKILIKCWRVLYLTIRPQIVLA